MQSELASTGPSFTDANFSGCTFVSKEEEHAVFISKLVTTSFGITVNALAVFVLLIFKSYYLLIFRILMYIVVANFFQVLVQLLEIFPIINEDDYNKVKDGSSWLSACRALGFLDQVTAWMGHLCMLWLVVYFLDLIRNRKRLEKAVLSRREIVGIGVCFFFPFVLNWIPFINDYYGISGSWCWIKITKEICNDTDISTGFTYILAMNYVPLLLFVLVNATVCVIIFAIWFSRTRSNVTNIIFVIFYPIFYGALFIIVAISRIESTLRIKYGRKQSYAFWIVHSIADPLRIIFPSLLMIIAIPLFGRKVIMNLRNKEAINDNEKNDQYNEKKRLLGSA